MQLRSMSLDKLVALKNQVEAALSAKVAEQRRMVEAGLSAQPLPRRHAIKGRRSDAAPGEKLLPNTAIRTIQPKPGQGAD